MTFRILSGPIVLGALLAVSSALAGNYPVTNDRGRIIGYSDYPSRPADAVALQDCKFDFSRPMESMKALFGNTSDSVAPSDSTTPPDSATPAYDQCMPTAPDDTGSQPADVQIQTTNDKNRRL